MYIPEIYAQNDPSEIKNFIKENSMGVLITSTGNPEPSITHLPFLLIEKDNDFFIETHLANKNGHLDQLKIAKMGTVVFQGPNTYISSSVYHHQNVPTWNYQAVHVFGTIEFMNELELQSHLEKSIDFFEDKRHKQLNYSSLNTNMLSGYLKQITGIRIIPYKIEAKYKLSQNRNEQDFQSIVTDLSESPQLTDQAVAQVMKNEKKRTLNQESK